MSTGVVSAVSVGVVVVAVLGVVLLGRGQPATPQRLRRRGQPAGTASPGPVPDAHWTPLVEPDRVRWWQRLRSGVGLAVLLVLVGLGVAALIGIVTAVVYLVLRDAVS